MMTAKLDDLDRNILKYLLNDSRQSFQDIANDLDVSGGTIHVRVNKLKEMGIITGSHISVDYEKLGLGVCVFIGINLSSAKSYNSAVQKLTSLREITEIYYTTGQYSMFVKVLLEDTKHLHTFLIEKLQRIEEVQSTETLIVLDQPVHREGSW